MKLQNYQRDMIKFFLLIIISSTIALANDIKVMVIDTGITASNLNLDPYIDKDDMTKHPNSYTDFHYTGHGTIMAGLIVKNVCKQVKLYSCNYWIEDFPENTYNPHLLACFQRAIDEHMNIINFSGGGQKQNDDEENLLKKMLENGKTFLVTAAGNEGTNLGKKCEGYYPACYKMKNLVLVGNVDETTVRPYNKARHSNYGYPGMVWRGGQQIKGTGPGNRDRFMDGTSVSAAVYTNSLLNYLCKEINK